MGGRSRTRWAAVALGVTGLLCAVLGAVMIVVVPSLIRQQVLKVGESARGSGRPARGSRALGQQLPTSPHPHGPGPGAQGLCWRHGAWVTDHSGPDLSLRGLGPRTGEEQDQAARGAA